MMPSHPPEEQYTSQTVEVREPPFRSARPRTLMGAASGLWGPAIQIIPIPRQAGGMEKALLILLGLVEVALSLLL